MEVLRNEVATRKANPPPFLVKTYILVEDPSTDAVISWNTNGTAFVVWQPPEFARDLLPTLFKHSNFSSFIRQLNTYGFRKVATTRWEFCNDMFQKGKRELLCQIRRRKAWAHRPHPPPTATSPNESEAVDVAASEVETELKSSSSTSSTEQMSNLSDENKRLKKENGMLSSELSCMKSKCKELLDLVALYTRSEPVNPLMISNGDGVKEEKRDEANDDKRMKLFGVRLDVNGGQQDGNDNKRKRSSNEDCHHQVYNQSSSSSAKFVFHQICKY